MNPQEKYQSLFEYLGKPAGGELGKSVADEAARQKVKFAIKQVSTKTYSGDIMVYPVSFLDSYFDVSTPNFEEYDGDELPF